MFNTQRVDHMYQDPHLPHGQFHLHYGDLTDSTNLIRILGLNPIRFYEASTNEFYGAFQHVFQAEVTSFPTELK